MNFVWCHWKCNYRTADKQWQELKRKLLMLYDFNAKTGNQQKRFLLDMCTFYLINYHPRVSWSSTRCKQSNRKGTTLLIIKHNSAALTHLKVDASIRHVSKPCSKLVYYNRPWRRSKHKVHNHIYSSNEITKRFYPWPGNLQATKFVENHIQSLSSREKNREKDALLILVKHQIFWATEQISWLLPGAN